MSLHSNIELFHSEVKLPLVTLPIKMTSIKLESSFLIISPLPKLKPTLEKLNSIGEVTDIIAPSLFHDLGVGKAAQTFPDARLWGPRKLSLKKPQYDWNCLSRKLWPYEKELPIFPLSGMPSVNEFLFIHRASKTLIVTDFCFNHIHGKGLGYLIIFSLFGTYKRFAISKFFLKQIKDKAAFKTSIDNLLNEEFDNIIIPHGENIIGNAKEKLTEALIERKIIKKL